jgi:hypothetical protein
VNNKENLTKKEMATEDWETTCLIYGDNRVHTVLDNRGILLHGSIDLRIPLKNIVFGRRYDATRFRFWTIPEQYIDLRVALFCHPVDNRDSYRQVKIELISTYPQSFPEKEKWLTWLQTTANILVNKDQISYTVCDFIEHQSLQYFNVFDPNDGWRLIVFTDHGPTFYDSVSIILDPRHPIPFLRHDRNGKISAIYEEQPLRSTTEVKGIWTIVKAWDEWLPLQCPICLDLFTVQQDGYVLSCNHAFCRPCISRYFQVKVEEIGLYRTNPFLCPIVSCRQSLPIVGCVKPCLSCQDVDRIKEWYKDLKKPPCVSLPQCLRRHCHGKLRLCAVDDKIVYCESCNTQWCSLCLKRVKFQHEDKDCESTKCLQFCLRFLAASDKAKQRCLEKWPFMQLYAKSRVPDRDAIQWIKDHGQVCPGCQTGIERSEGCFHMSCKCGTHFCYECGEQIFYLFYGTHKCWERQDV